LFVRIVNVKHIQPIRIKDYILKELNIKNTADSARNIPHIRKGGKVP